MNNAVDILNKQIAPAIPALTDAQRRTGKDQELDFAGGLTLRVTSHQARIYAYAPDEATLEALEDSGRNFTVVEWTL